jgi:hypothetical protein
MVTRVYLLRKFGDGDKLATSWIAGFAGRCAAGDVIA